MIGQVTVVAVAGGGQEAGQAGPGATAAAAEE